jgi:hypothetical protein
VAVFERYADRIYEFVPDGEKGVRVKLREDRAVEEDGGLSLGE